MLSFVCAHPDIEISIIISGNVILLIFLLLSSIYITVKSKRKLSAYCKLLATKVDISPEIAMKFSLQIVRIFIM